MPRKYIGSFDRALIRHPVSGVVIEVARDEPTTELDDLGPEIDLGPDWVDAPAEPPAGKKPAPAPVPAPAPQEGV